MVKRALVVWTVAGGLKITKVKVCQIYHLTYLSVLLSISLIQAASAQKIEQICERPGGRVRSIQMTKTFRLSCWAETKSFPKLNCQ